MDSGIFRRLPGDYQDDPELLAADLAWVIMTAQCAARLAGVALDIEGAIKVGTKIFATDFPELDAPASAGVLPAAD
jgi:hypothetical protein